MIADGLPLQNVEPSGDTERTSLKSQRVYLRDCGILLILALCPAMASAARKLPPEPRGQPPVPRAPSGDWPKYCGNLQMTGVARHGSGIPREEVSLLTLHWSRRLGGAIASSPVVARGTLYVGDWAGLLWALDPSSGEVRASADLGTTDEPQCSPNPIGITSAPHVVGRIVYLAGGNDSFYAVDAQTLAVIWKVRLGDNSPEGGYYGWCSPAVVEGKVLQGVASDCDNPFVPGKLIALDAETGQTLAQAPLVPDGVVGGGVWTSPAVDLATRKVFVTTASAHDLDDGLAFSIVRLSLQDLTIEDSWKVDPGGLEDADWGSSPTLFEDSSRRPLVGAGQKDGRYYAFDRKDLARGPVWTVPIARPGDCPQCGDGTLSTAAFDGRRLYLAGGVPPDAPDMEDGGTVVALDPSTGAILWRRSFEGGPGIAPVSLSPGAVFAAVGDQLLALDRETGETLWSFRAPTWLFGGIAIARGRIYFGDLQGNLYAFGPPEDSTPGGFRPRK